MIYVPASGPESWRALLADPEKQWRSGFSAKALAHCWQESNGFPETVRNVLDSNAPFVGAQMLLGFVEHKVSLRGRGKPSQTDLFVLAKLADRSLATIAVEGKVGEPFGETVEEWLSIEPSPNKMERLQYLVEILGIDIQVVSASRYQLLHRTASALLEAQRYNAQHAMMLVHSFSRTNAWYDDYCAFARMLGGSPQSNAVTTIGDRSVINLHLAWVKGDERFLTL
jgi:hypothetical protein